MRADLATRSIVSGDQIANTHADTVGGVTHHAILGLGADGFAEEIAVFFIVNIDGRSALNGCGDGHVRGISMGVCFGFV